MKQRNIFKPTRMSMAVMIALATPAVVQLAHAGAGWGDNTDVNGTAIKVATYYANSPSGIRDAASCFDATGITAIPALGGLCDSGTALRKFVDTLPLLGQAGANDLGQYLPVAAPEKWRDMNGALTQDDYYEIAIVEYREQMHKDLPVAGTRLRGYVQLETLGNAATSKHIALSYPDGTPILNSAGVPVLAYDKPHYLGPIISANKGVAVRIKYTNYLPFGAMKGSQLFIPVDDSMQSAGVGPDGVTPYTQNRAAIHWHGGDTPWISDGTPHQWVAPAGEAAAYAAGYGKGASTQNVPDMPDPGPGAGTLFFPNNLSGRFMFYHDHTSGLTRLNVYAGIAAGYMITDPTEKALVTGGSLPNLANPANPVVVAAGTLPAEQIPLVIQDKTFVPKDIAQQDAKWNVRTDGTLVPPADPTAWGEYGDLWFPHVYEVNQDPNSIDGTNPVGRWDWGPWFWPVFPAQYSLPSGHFGDVSTTPEAFMDTPVINGTVYPTTTVQPKPYRFRILNASNDRFINLGLYVADTTSAEALAVQAKTTVLGTEVPMVTFANGATRPAGSPYGAGTTVTFPDGTNPATAGLQGTGWGTPDSMMHAAGVPDPLAAGPDIIQIGTEGGFLPSPVTIPSTPINYEYNKRSVTVLNVLEHGLFMGPAERADVVIDFSAYKGKTLILYNDAPAPLPAGDPRIDYYTGNGDNTTAGGAEPTRPGYGPNTRTMMRIVVDANGVAQPFDTAALEIALPAAYAVEQDRPVIPEAAYNKAFGTTDANNYASIFTGSLAQPTFDYTPTSAAGSSQTIVAVNLVNGGGGYLTPPTVVFTPPAGAQGSGATAKAGLGIGGITLKAGGLNYNVPPTVVFSGGADPTGKPYTAADWASLTPPAAAKATIVAGRLQGINVINPGSFSVMPTVTFKTEVGNTGSGAGATVKSSGKLTSVVLTCPGGSAPDVVAYPNCVPAPPAVYAGTNYTADPIITFTGGGGTGATAKASTNLTQRLPVLNKGIQELFDPVYGRMNATFSVELPFTTALTQTTIPLAYVDESTEEFRDSEFQIWKITHNGVDSHPVHFHLVNVQVINRVGWDGTIKEPYANEVGWKETVRMNPLEDVYVVTKAKTPVTPGFGVPESIRLEDPSQPAGSNLGFTQIDPKTGNPALRVNKVDNFDNEYVWHCHILGHEENDFMRPVIFHPFVIDSVVGSPSNGQWIVPGTSTPLAAGQLAIPSAPTALAATSAAQGVVLNWTDTARTEYQFDVMRAVASVDPAGAIILDAANNPVIVGAYAKIGQALANELGYVDATAVAGTAYAYKVVAVGAKGQNESTPTSITAGNFVIPTTPALTAVVNDPTHVALGWGNVTGEVSFIVQRSADAGFTWSTIAPSLAMNTTGYIDNTAIPNSTYQYQVIAVNAVGPAPSNIVTPVATPVAAVANVLQTSTIDTVNLSWSNANAGVTTIAVTRDGLAAPTAIVAANGLSLTDTGLNANTVYTYAITVTGANGSATTTVAAATGVVPATGLTVTGATTTTADLSWTLPAGTLSNVQLLRNGTPVCDKLGVAVPLCTAVGATAMSFSDTGLTSNTVYNYTVVVTNAAGSTATTAAVPATTLPVAATVNVPTTTANYVSLSWTNPNPGTSTVSVLRTDLSGATLPVTYTSANGVTATGFMDLAVAANTAYSYAVTVTGVNGATAAAVPVNATTLPAALVVPSTLSATTTANTATLTWNNAINNGGTSTISVTRNGVLAVSSLAGNSTNWTDNALVPNTPYTYVVTVTGQAGVAANASTTITGTTLPAAMTLAAPVVTARAVTLNWTQPVQGPLTNIQIWDGATLVSTLPGTAVTSGAISVLPKSTHNYTVVSVGLNGNTAVATTVPATITTPAELLLVNTLTAQMTDAATIMLNWTDTSTGETGYRVEQRLNGGAWTVINPSVVSAVQGQAMSLAVPVGTLTRYDFRVTALDGAIVGPINATTMRVDLSIVPNRPATLTAAVVALPTKGAVTLTWPDATTNNSSYDVQVHQRSAAGVWGAWTNLPSVGANAITTPVTGLTSGLQTEFQIRAVNPKGASTWRLSNRVTVN